MRNIFIIVFALPLLLPAIPAANSSGIEKYGKDDFDETDGRQIAILWDIYHGVNPFLHYRNHPDTMNTVLRSILLEMGHPLVVSDSGILHLDLREFCGIIIAPQTTWDSPYSDEEVSLIRNFVREGGGLLIMGDHGGFRPENINPVAQAFGATTGLDVMLPQLLIVTNLTPHPIFIGVDTLYFTLAGQLGSAPPSQPVAWDDPGRLVVAVAESGEGRVVITGDANAFIDPDPLFGIEENETFVRNIIRWLFGKGCFSFSDLDETLAEAEINNRGVWRSLQSKADNARRQFEEGHLRTAGNILCALLHEVDGQEGKHITPPSAQEIRDCIHSLADALGIPLPCLDRVEKVALLLKKSPNPFSTTTQLHYTIPDFSGYQSEPSRPIRVRLAIYDISGRLIKTLVDRPQKPGVYQFPITSNQLPGSGIYFYHLRAGDYTDSGKLILLK
jgi:hypothetical protein